MQGFKMTIFPFQLTQWNRVIINVITYTFAFPHVEWSNVK